MRGCDRCGAHPNRWVSVYGHSPRRARYGNSVLCRDCWNRGRASVVGLVQRGLVAVRVESSQARAGTR